MPSSLVPSVADSGSMGVSGMSHDDGWYAGMAERIWALMGLRPPAPSVIRRYGRVDAIPRSCSWVVAVADEIASVTMLSDGECLLLLDRIVGDMGRRHGGVPSVRSVPSLLALVRAYAAHPDREPEWHARMRGDAVPIDGQAWRVLMDVRDDRVSVATLRSMRRRVPRVVANADRRHCGFARLFSDEVDAAVARHGERVQAYDALGNPMPDWR